MIKIIIYTKINCPYCQNAKQLLTKENIKFKEIVIDKNQVLFNQIIKLSGAKTVPQIFYNNKYLGGWNDLYNLYMKENLNSFFKT